MWTGYRILINKRKVGEFIHIKKRLIIKKI